jgi:hypothetical protein
MDIYEIERTIEKLEKAETTYGNCEKLAWLYIVREHWKNKSEIEMNRPINYMHYKHEKEEEEKHHQSEFMKMTNEHGTDKIICRMNRYLEHARVNKPVEYARMIDYLKSEC